MKWVILNNTEELWRRFQVIWISLLKKKRMLDESIPGSTHYAVVKKDTHRKKEGNPAIYHNMVGP